MNQDEIESEVQFLLDRLAEIEPELNDEAFREYAGHVLPSVERLKVALSRSAAHVPVAPVAWQWRYSYDPGKWSEWGARREDAAALLASGVILGEQSRGLYVSPQPTFNDGVAEEVALDMLSSLVAAVSLLERGGKKAAPSDKMFALMLADYHASIERGRTALRALKDHRP